MPELKITLESGGKVLAEETIPARNFVKVTEPFFALVVGEGPFTLDRVGPNLVVSEGPIKPPTEPMTIRKRSEYLIAALTIRRAARLAMEELARLGIIMPWDADVDGPVTNLSGAPEEK
jgi:hypothetical protein